MAGRASRLAFLPTMRRLMKKRPCAFGSLTILALTGVYLCGVVAAAGQPAQGKRAVVQSALDAALARTGVVAVVLEEDGGMLAAEHAAEAANLQRAPGSVLKPLFLAAALREGKVRAETTVVCHGNLRLAGRDLACTHPREENVLNAERALAWSCNEWFAQMALRFTPEQAAAVLRGYGFGSRAGLATEESAGVVREARNAAETQLMVLGLDDVEVTPAQLAEAYSKLAREWSAEPVVERGLRGSVEYGMAHNAATAGMAIAGKTGTASDAGEAWTHGWFAGIAEKKGERVAAVFYVPHGSGADAALMAHRFFALWGRAE